MSAIKTSAATIARIAILGSALVLAWLAGEDLARFPRTEDAAITANIVGVAPQVGGSITAIHVADNARVRRGDPLFEIDERPYRAETDRARARLELVKLEVRALEDEVAAARATLEERRARAAYAADHAARVEKLLAGNFASPDRVQRAQSEARSAEALVRESEAALRRAENNLGQTPTGNTRVEEAAATLRDAELKLSYCKVYAPCDGRINDLRIAPGVYAAPGEEIFSVVDDSAWYAFANFRESDLKHIRPGQKASVFPMAGGGPLAGTVAGIASAVDPLSDPSRAAAGGQGILERVRPTFDFIQLAQRFPVRILLDVPAGSELRSGGKAAAVVDTRDTPDQNRAAATPSPFVPPASDG